MYYRRRGYRRRRYRPRVRYVRGNRRRSIGGIAYSQARRAAYNYIPRAATTAAIRYIPGLIRRTYNRYQTGFGYGGIAQNYA